MKIQKVLKYRSAFIVQLSNGKEQRIETVNADNKMYVRKSMQSAKYCITREINKKKSAQA